MFKQVRGVWLPDAEEHLVPFIERGPDFAGAGTYQLHKIQAAFPHIRNFRHAVDVGGHVGLWSRVLVRCFANLTAFEPVPMFRTCFERNVRADDHCRLDLVGFALGERSETVHLDIDPESTGGTHVTIDADTRALAVEVRTLDSFRLEHVDFLKIDCEGYEYFVLKGAEETVRRDHPCVVVEQKPRKGSQYGIDDRAAVRLLESWGAQLRYEITGDYCFSWP